MLTSYYRSSLSAALTSVYPEHKFNGWQFQNVSKGYWQNVDNQREYMGWLGAQLKVEKMEDWYKIRARDVIPHGGASLLYP